MKSRESIVKERRRLRAAFAKARLAEGMTVAQVNYALAMMRTLETIEDARNKLAWSQALDCSLKDFYGPMIRRILTRKVRLYNYLVPRARAKEPMDQRHRFPAILGKRK
jgi:hypothetical protein